MLAFDWTPWWGTLPDYLAAAGTVGAFFAGLRLLRKELDARREYEDDRRRAQASRVACWVGVVEDPDSPPLPWADPDLGRRAVAAVFNNGSEEPVYDCQVHLELDPDLEAMGGGFFWVRVEGVLQKEGHRLTLKERTLPPGRIQRPLSLSRAEIPYVSTWMTFTDAAGRRWTRHRDGQLEGPPEARRSVKDRLDAFAKGQVEELDP